MRYVTKIGSSYRVCYDSLNFLSDKEVKSVGSKLNKTQPNRFEYA